MSTTPDPQTVREIARKCLSDHIRRFPEGRRVIVGTYVLKALGDPDLAYNDHATYQAWCDAVSAEVRAAVPSWPDGQPQDEPDADGGGFAWHDLHYGLGPDPFGPEPESRYHQLFHPAQCRTLPTGAVCWAVHEPYEHWWPAEDGVYRIRPVQWLTGSDPNGGEPDVNVSMEIQRRGDDGEWQDWNGRAVGQRTDSEYRKNLDRWMARSSAPAELDARETKAGDA